MKALLCLSLLWLTAPTGKTSEHHDSQESLIRGRILRIEEVVDDEFKQTCFRWIIDVSPLRLPGFGERLYQQVKVFNLMNTKFYHPGVSISFNYKLVPYHQQTSFRSRYEWLATPAHPAGSIALPEIMLSNVKRLP
jgi:hypothetical protein